MINKTYDRSEYIDGVAALVAQALAPEATANLHNVTDEEEQRVFKDLAGKAFSIARAMWEERCNQSESDYGYKAPKPPKPRKAPKPRKVGYAWEGE